MKRPVVRALIAALLMSVVSIGVSSRYLGAGVADAAGRTSPSPSEPQPWKTLLIYNQQTGTFPSLTVAANQRIIIRHMNANALVPVGQAPAGGVWVAPIDPVGSGWLGAFQEAFSFAMTSNFQGVQDRWAASSGAFVILEGGQQLTWYLSNRAGENPFNPVSAMAASLSLSGEIVTIQ